MTIMDYNEEDDGPAHDLLTFKQLHSNDEAGIDTTALAIYRLVISLKLWDMWMIGLSISSLSSSMESIPYLLSFQRLSGKPHLFNLPVTTLSTASSSPDLELRISASLG